MKWKRNQTSETWHLFPDASSGQIKSVCGLEWLHFMHWEQRTTPKGQRCITCQLKEKS